MDRLSADHRFLIIHRSLRPCIRHVRFATGSRATLFDLTGNLSTSYGLKSWIKAGVLRRKVIMGLPFYGKTWSLKDPEVSGLGASAMSIGQGQKVA
uniref:GH18 domain-containing protein n=1 Tax=Daucus carota subsp. sativus TaxID=79200 RepID=A0A166DB24_DAUCS